MLRHLRACLLLLVSTVVIFCVLYPLVLLGIGKTAFPAQAEGSLVDRNGNLVTDPSKAVGSRLIAQAFSKDEYFQPRPSATSPAYNAAASGASNWSANNVQLRDRVAQALGPIVKYAAGEKKGTPVGPDIDAWFKKDTFQGKPGIVAQWADANNSTAQNWVGTLDPKNPSPLQQYILGWAKSHPADVAKFKKDNPDDSDPSPQDLAVVFFESVSKENPGKFPGAVDHTAADGKTEKKIDLVSEGSDVQSTMFDLWLADHPKAELEKVPGDLVTASGSGLDPDITLDNAEYQLDRVAGAWAEKLHRDAAGVSKEIEAMLQERATAPLGGLVGVKMINVLEMNIALTNRYAPAPSAK